MSEATSQDIITITVSEYLTHDLAEKIAAMQWHDTTPKFVNQVRRSIYEDKYFSDCFNVIAQNNGGDVVGRISYLQNQENPRRWFHGNLNVAPECRRMRIATRMIQAGIERVTDLGGEVIHGYTAKTNEASIRLHKSLRFVEKPIIQFDNLIHGEEQIMLERSLGSGYNVIPATADEAIFVALVYAQNREILHGKSISFKEWQEILSRDDPDERNFLICRGAIPIAWLRANGLCNPRDTGMAWISMLAVSDKNHRQGVGTYAVRYAEDFVRSMGFTRLSIHTTEDNTAARALYAKCGYEETEYGDCTTGDGVKRNGYTYEKTLSSAK